LPQFAGSPEGPLPKAAETLALHLEELRADGKKLAVPSTLEQIMADPSNQSGVAVMIEGT
jgi:hypothetical protein